MKEICPFFVRGLLLTSIFSQDDRKKMLGFSAAEKHLNITLLCITGCMSSFLDVSDCGMGFSAPDCESWLCPYQGLSLSSSHCSTCTQVSAPEKILLIDKARV